MASRCGSGGGGEGGVRGQPAVQAICPFQKPVLVGERDSPPPPSTHTNTLTLLPYTVPHWQAGRRQMDRLLLRKGHSREQVSFVVAGWSVTTNIEPVSHFLLLLCPEEQLLVGEE